MPIVLAPLKRRSLKTTIAANALALALGVSICNSARPTDNRAQGRSDYPRDDTELNCLIDAAGFRGTQRLECEPDMVDRLSPKFGYAPAWPEGVHATVDINWLELTVDIEATGFPRPQHFHHRIDAGSSMVHENKAYWLAWEDERPRGQSIRNKTYVTYRADGKWTMQIEPSTGWPPGSYHKPNERYFENFVCHGV